MADIRHSDYASGQNSAQVRKHYYLDQYVIIAPQRSKRPQQVKGEPVSHKTKAHHPIEDDPSIYEATDRQGNWQVKVVANKYPALTEDNHEASGSHEVVLETPKVGTTLSQLSLEEISQILKAYQQRAHLLRQRYGYVSIFKNQGYRAGASLAHTHSQIIASAMVPPHVLRERQMLTKYQMKHKTSALCDIVRWEIEQNKRTVAHTRHTTTLCPYASQFALETWIVPNRQSHSIVDLNEEEILSLSDHLKGVALALDSNEIDFNYHLQEGIAEEYNHFYIKVSPRITTQSGYELNTGVYINPISPESACLWYQKHIKTPDVV